MISSPLDRLQQPPILEPAELQLQAPERLTLTGGVPLNILRAGDSEVIRIDLVVRGGRWHQTQPLQALFTNRMLREGTRRYSAARLSEQLDYYGALLELSSSNEYSFLTLYTLSRYFSETLDLLVSMVAEPIFSPERLDLVVANNLQRHRVNLERVDFQAQRSLLRHLYGAGHPLGQVVEEAHYRALTSDALRSFYEEYYRPSCFTLYASGAVTDDCVRRLDDAFGAAASSVFAASDASVPVTPPYHPCPSADRRLFVPRKGAMQSAVCLGHLTIGCTHPDYHRLRVLISLFGGYFGSRLMQNIREEKGYTYGISAGLLTYPGHGRLVISAEADNRYVEPLITEVYHEIERLQTELVPEDELQMVRHYLIGELCRSYESAFSLSDAWIFQQTMGVGMQFNADAFEAIKTVTSEQLRELARRYLIPSEMKEAVCGDL